MDSRPHVGVRRRPNRPAAERRAQAARAQSRAVQLLLRGFRELGRHRGCRPSALGAALHTALGGSDASAQGPHGASSELDAAALRARALEQRLAAVQAELQAAVSWAVEANRRMASAAEEMAERIVVLLDDLDAAVAAEAAAATAATATAAAETAAETAAAAAEVEAVAVPVPLAEEEPLVRRLMEAVPGVAAEAALSALRNAGGLYHPARRSLAAEAEAAASYAEARRSLAAEAEAAASYAEAQRSLAAEAEAEARRSLAAEAEARRSLSAEDEEERRLVVRRLLEENVVHRLMEDFPGVDVAAARSALRNANGMEVQAHHFLQ